MALEGEAPDRTKDGIAGQAFRGSLIGTGASAATLILGFLRSVLLARFLAPEHFGILTLALFYIGLTAQFRALGLDRAIIHRQDATEQTLGTYFTLRVATLLGSLGLLSVVVLLLSHVYSSPLLPFGILIALAGIDLVKGLSSVQETLLSKDLAFRSLAITDIAASATMTVVGPLLAWVGWGAWALVAERASGILVRFILTWFVFGQWRPRLAWDTNVVRWLLNYGRSAWGASNLAFLLDRFDDFWIGTALGKTPLGYYSRAYEFTRYPRRVVANPLVGVFSPIFARLQADRLRLSQAFYRAAHIILRSGFLIAGAFALIMPEFINLVIGEQWAPMLLTFRLMLVYTLLDALLMLGGSLLLAIGQPQRLRHSRLIQTVFFIPAVFIGARLGGINGVALAADGMLAVGTWVLYRQLRDMVDFSLTKLSFWPLVAFIVAFGTGLWLEASTLLLAPWLVATSKLGIFTGLYLSILAVTERGDYLKGIRWLWSHARSTAKREARS